MSKRFTATEKWDDPWFTELSANEKLFWIFLLDKCNHAGIYQPNKLLIRVYLGNFEPEEHLEKFGNRIVVLTPQKWFIPKFIEFQYGTLNPENRAHLSVIKALEKEGLYKPLRSFFQEAKDKDKDKEKDKDKDKDKEKDKDSKSGFSAFWGAYPEKVGKDKARESWEKKKPPLDQCLKAIENQKESKRWKEGYIPNPATWLNQGRWQDEVGAVNGNQPAEEVPEWQRTK